MDRRNAPIRAWRFVAGIRPQQIKLYARVTRNVARIATNIAKLPELLQQVAKSNAKKEAPTPFRKNVEAEVFGARWPYGGRCASEVNLVSWLKYAKRVQTI